MFALIASAFSAVASIFGWSKQRDADKNRPDIVRAKTAQLQESDRDVARKDAAEAEAGNAAALADLQRREAE